MFERFDENPAMTLQDIKETKRYGRTHAQTDGRTDGQRENSIPHHKQSLRGYIKETKRYRQTHAQTDGRTDNVKTVYPTTNKVCGVYNQEI